MCLVSGVTEQIARLHEPKIKGVADAQPSGALLVSFNASSFESYGKSQSFNAPVGLTTAFRYANALNHLLERRDRRVALGDSTVVFWADHPNNLETCLSELFAEAPPEESATVEEDKERIRQAKLLLMQLRDGTGWYRHRRRRSADEILPARALAERVTSFRPPLGGGRCSRAKRALGPAPA